MSQQLDLDRMDVLGEFADQLVARKDGSTGDLGFSFQSLICIHLLGELIGLIYIKTEHNTDWLF
jgi:hypothetical protein